MSGPRRRATGEAGLTLIEVLVTVVILGVAFVTVVGGMAVSIAGSDMHRKQATSQTVLRNLAEFLKAAPYEACPADYASALADFSAQVREPTTAPVDPLGPPAEGVAYTVELVDPVEVWDGSNPASFVAPGEPCVDRGLQQLTLRVQSVARSGLPAEELVIVKRRE